MLGKKWLALLVIGTGLALAAAACGGGGSKKDSGVVVTAGTPGAGLPADFTPISTPQGVPTPIGPAASADELGSIAANFGKAKSFRATLTQTSNPTSSTTVELVRPDKVHIAIKNGAVTQEAICVGTSLYSKGTDAKWTKVDKDPNGKAIDCGSGVGAIFPTKSIEDGLKAAADDKSVSKGGMDTVNGKKCQLFSQINGNGTSAEFCVADQNLVRIVDKTGGATIVFSDYNSNIDIKAPI